MIPSQLWLTAYRPRVSWSGSERTFHGIIRPSDAAWIGRLRGDNLNVNGMESS